MRSTFTKILFWAIGTIAVSIVGFIATGRLIETFRPGQLDFIARTQVLQLEDARRAYEDGGPERLARYLIRLDEIFEAKHFLVDVAGKDLADGQNRADLLASATPSPLPPRHRGGRIILSGPSAEDGSRLLIIVRPKFRPGGSIIYYLWILLVIVGLGYALAVHFARPLRGLRRAVDRFGRGDLRTRIGSVRRDEFGDLARAFDLMAERIENLLTAQQRLLQDVSHELRSPLTRLGLVVRLARSSNDHDASLDRIKKEVDRISRLVDELLQLSRAEDDAQSRAEEVVRLDELLKELVDDCRFEAEAKGCRLVLRSAGPASLLGESDLLRRAFENVLRNAVRHAPQDSVVEIEVGRRDDMVKISMRDRGAGVPEESLAAIFAPFFRVDGDRSRSSGGVGLGLAISRRAVALHGGKIVACNAHPGLNVTIELPHALPLDQEMPQEHADECDRSDDRGG